MRIAILLIALMTLLRFPEAIATKRTPTLEQLVEAPVVLLVEKVPSRFDKIAEGNETRSTLIEFFDAINTFKITKIYGNKTLTKLKPEETIVIPFLTYGEKEIPISVKRDNGDLKYRYLSNPNMNYDTAVNAKRDRGNKQFLFLNTADVPFVLERPRMYFNHLYGSPQSFSQESERFIESYFSSKKTLETKKGKTKTNQALSK